MGILSPLRPSQSNSQGSIQSGLSTTWSSSVTGLSVTDESRRVEAEIEAEIEPDGAASAELAAVFASPARRDLEASLDRPSVTLDTALGSLSSQSSAASGASGASAASGRALEAAVAADLARNLQGELDAHTATDAARGSPTPRSAAGSAADDPEDELGHDLGASPLLLTLDDLMRRRSEAGSDEAGGDAEARSDAQGGGDAEVAPGRGSGAAGEARRGSFETLCRGVLDLARQAGGSSHLDAAATPSADAAHPARQARTPQVSFKTPPVPRLQMDAGGSAQPAAAARGTRTPSGLGKPQRTDSSVAAAPRAAAEHGAAPLTAPARMVGRGKGGVAAAASARNASAARTPTSSARPATARPAVAGAATAPRPMGARAAAAGQKPVPVSELPRWR